MPRVEGEAAFRLKHAPSPDGAPQSGTPGCGAAKTQHLSADWKEARNLPIKPARSILKAVSPR